MPADVRNNPVPVQSEKVGDGTVHSGVSAYSVLIEMKDYLVVIELPRRAAFAGGDG